MERKPVKLLWATGVKSHLVLPEKNAIGSVVHGLVVLLFPVRLVKVQTQESEYLISPGDSYVSVDFEKHSFRTDLRIAPLRG